MKKKEMRKLGKVIEIRIKLMDLIIGANRGGLSYALKLRTIRCFFLNQSLKILHFNSYFI